MTPPDACRSVTELRAAIDTLDADIVRLMALRARYIDRASELKLVEGLPANIPVRVEEVVAKVRRSAALEGFDPDLAEAIWRRLIAWSIAREEAAMAQAGD
jgi:isochorismate pyruvate lyase